MRIEKSQSFGLVATLLLSIAAISVIVGMPARAQDKPAARARPEDALIGEWWTEGREGRLNFQRYRDGTYRGTTTCCTPVRWDADHPRTDMHNPNPALRERSTLGIVIVWKLVFEDGAYSGGYVYNPRDGKTYRMKVELLDSNTLKIRGYLGISLLGQSQIWKRATQAELSTSASR